MKKTITLALAASALFAAAACTSTEKVAVKQPGDAKLSCAQIDGEFAKLDTIMEDAQRDKGVNTENVAAVLLFWPAAVGNYMNAADAEKLVDRRREHLMGIYAEKGCDA